jgi:hypothetical protein
VKLSCCAVSLCYVADIAELFDKRLLDAAWSAVALTKSGAEYFHAPLQRRFGQDRNRPTRSHIVALAGIVIENMNEGRKG